MLPLAGCCCSLSLSADLACCLRRSYYSAVTSYARMTSGASYWPQSSTSAAAFVSQGDLLSASTVFGTEAAKAVSALVLLYVGKYALASLLLMIPGLFLTDCF